MPLPKLFFLWKSFKDKPLNVYKKAPHEGLQFKYFNYIKAFSYDFHQCIEQYGLMIKCCKMIHKVQII